MDGNQEEREREELGGTITPEGGPAKDAVHLGAIIIWGNTVMISDFAA